MNDRASIAKSSGEHAAQSIGQSAGRRDRSGLWLFLLLAAVYLFSYSGRFHAIDEVSVAAMTESLVKQARVTTDQIWWSQGWTPSQGRVGPDGHLYSKKGLGSALLGAPFYWLAMKVPGAGEVRVLMLANALVTALTGWLLYACVRLLGFRPAAAVLTALAYGLGTMAWPYARYFFSEPLTALGLTAGLWGLLAYRESRRLRYASIAGLGLGAALLAKVANVVVWPFYAVHGLWTASRQDGRGQTMKERASGLLPFAAAFGLPLVGACLALVAYNLARSGHPLDLGYAADETFSTPLWFGLAGLLVSPGKGLFLFSPILIAALFGLPSLFRRDRATALLSLCVAAAYPLLYAGWFMWWGGWSWGPRFLVPSLPFLSLFLAPVFDWVLQPGRRWAIGALLALGLLSVGVQILGVMVDFNQYLLLLYERGLDSGEINFQVALSPILGHWRLLRNGLAAENGPGAFDLAWSLDRAGAVDWPRLLWPLALLIVVSLGWWAAWKSGDAKGLAARAGRAGWVLACAALLVVSMAVLARLPEPTDDWQAGSLALSDAMRGAARNGDAMVLDLLPFGDHLDHTTSLLDRYKAAPTYWGWARQEPVSAERQAELVKLGERHGRLWLVLDTTPEADPASTTERWLDENAFRVASRWLSPAMRLVSYVWPGNEAAPTEQTGLHLGVGDRLRLEGFGPACTVSSDGVHEGRCQGQGPIEVRAGDILTFSLKWRAEQAVEQDYTVFVQLLDQDGQLRGQIDRSPVGGFRPTHTWQAGEAIDDHYGLELPRDLAPGRYQLIAGLYLPASGERLVVSGTGGAPMGDHARLADVIVAGGDGP